MKALSPKDALRAILGKRAAFLSGFLLRGMLRLIASGFRLRAPKRSGRADDYLLCDDTVLMNNLTLVIALHLLGIRRIRKVTASWSCREEGAGFQILLRMRAMAFARSLGLQYVHTPLFNIHQSEGAMADYCAKWEGLFNLGHGEEIADRVDLRVLDFSWAPNSGLLQLFGREESFVEVASIVPDLRRKFRAANPARRSAGGPLTVCLHVRRGWDMGPGNTGMWTGDAKIAAMLDWLGQVLRDIGGEHEICLVSRGEEAEFRRTFGEGIRYFLNEPSDVAVRRLIDADVLVMARSSFSYVAAVVGEGIRIYEPWDAPPLPGWLAMDDKGQFDRAAFAALLAGLRRLP